METVRVAAPFVYPGALAVISTGTLVKTDGLGTASMGKVWTVVLEAMTTLAGTVALAGLPLVSVTVRFVVGATVAVIVPVEAPAPALSATEVGLRVRFKMGAITVPLAATFTVVAPVLATAMFPAGDPASAVAARRAEIVPLALPPLCGRVAVGPKLSPSLATSKLAGAVTVTDVVRLVPETVKVWAAETAPRTALNGVSVPSVERVGTPAARTVPVTPTFTAVAPGLLSVTLPLRGPWVAEDVIRT